jgi:hypothetical protein
VEHQNSSHCKLFWRSEKYRWKGCAKHTLTFSQPALQQCIPDQLSARQPFSFILELLEEHKVDNFHEVRCTTQTNERPN